MRKIYFLIGVVFTTLLFACGNNNSKTAFIEGTIKDGQGQIIYLEKLLPNGTQLIDTAKIDKQGNFKIYKKAGEKSFYKLRLGIAVANGNYAVPMNEVILITDSTEKIHIEATASKFNQSYVITGSEETNLLKEIGTIASGSQLQLDSINQSYQKDPEHFDQKGALDKVNQIMTAQSEKLFDFLKQHEGKFVTQQALALVNPDKDFEAYKRAADAVIKKYGTNPFIQNLNAMLQNMMRFAIGVSAPDFTVKTPEGADISLHDFKGKYVLLDFWASWCGPCRQENPNLTATYSRFKSKNFEVFGVSLDQKKEAWTDAIQKDGLKWKHGSDLGYWNSAPAKLYNISQIPYNFLLDPEGKIVGKNLRGSDLDRKLEEIFGSI